MSDQYLGSFEITSSNFQNLLQWSMAPLGDAYDEAYINLKEQRLSTISNAGQAIVTYCTFREPFIENVDIADVEQNEAGLEAILKVPTINEYKNFIGGERYQVEFYGSENNRGATRMSLTGDLQAEFYLPSSNSNYETKQMKVVNHYNDDNQWILGDGEPMDVQFTTTMDQLHRIVDVVEFDDIVMSNYPIVIEDGEFKLHAEGEDQRQIVSGNLYAEDVEGPDVNNVYSRGFKQLVNNLSGEVSVSTQQDNPISIVRESNDGALTLRYTILPAT